MSKKGSRVKHPAISFQRERPSQFQNYAQMMRVGLENHRLGKIHDALGVYQKILKDKTQDFHATHMAGVACKQLGMTDLALSYFEKAIALQGLDASLQSNYGNLMLMLERFEEAISAYDVAISILAEFTDAYYNKGVALDALGRHEQAVQSYSQAIEKDANSPEYFLSRGNSYQQLKCFEEAVSDYQVCLKLQRNNHFAMLNLGIAYFRLRKFELSLVTLHKAQSFQEQNPVVHYYKGNVLRQLSRGAEAVASFLRAIELQPSEAKYYLDLGNAQLDMQRITEAIQSYRQALAVDPDYPYLLGHLIHVRCQIADWDELPSDLNAIQVGVEQGRKVSAPFPLLALFDDPYLAQRASSIYCQEHLQDVEKSKQSRNDLAKTQKGVKVRIGYFSSDFYRHATAYLMAQLFEQHDRSKFELIGFSFYIPKRDDMTRRIELAFDQYFDVSHLSDEAVAKLSQQLSIDIAVDLKGYTQNSRSEIFSFRCAPIQVSYLGYPATLSSPYIDFIVADKIVIPHSEEDHYCEKIVYLPHCYQVNDSKRVISPPHSSRTAHGLPEDSFVFCCFNNTYKIQPKTFALWMRILKRTPNSVLWLMEDSAHASQNLREHARRHHVDSSRLVFARRLDLPNHLERHRHAQLFLDTAPYNAHTTASDALWAGLLVLTLIGRSFASRVGASLLHELMLDEFICKSEKEYEDRAVFWAGNKELLQLKRDELAKEKESSRLFRGDLFAKSLELAYSEMYAQYTKGNGFKQIDLTTR
jgi:predicted O-linked N-acetylglucosamine transferase (SPINDLY family)